MVGRELCEKGQLGAPGHRKTTENKLKVRNSQIVCNPGPYGGDPLPQFSTSQRTPIGIRHILGNAEVRNADQPLKT